MITLIGVKRSCIDGRVDGVVVGEFGKGKKITPVVLFVVAVDSKVLFDNLVGNFG